jgi:maleate cis-trans isomerase
MTDAVHIGVLYTGPQPGDPYDEYETFAASLPVPVTMHVAFSRSDGIHRKDVIVQTGRVERMAQALSSIRHLPLRSVAFACTCGSFAYGPAGSRQQAEDLAAVAGVPATTTSQAFMAAATAMGLKRVVVLATYPVDVARLFVDLLNDIGTEVVALTSLDLLTGRQSNRLTPEELMDRVTGLDHDEAEAILVPDTAVRSLDIITPLEERLGKPVLTANQVTAWRAIRLAGLDCVQPRYGALMARVHSAPGEAPRPIRQPRRREP